MTWHSTLITDDVLRLVHGRMQPVKKAHLSDAIPAVRKKPSKLVQIGTLNLPEECSHPVRAPAMQEQVAPSTNS